MAKDPNPYFKSMMNSVVQERQQQAYQGGFGQPQYGNYGYNQYGQQQFTPQGPSQVSLGERALTVDDVIAKTGILLGVIVIAGIATFQFTTINPGLGMLLTLGAAAVTLVFGLISAFGKFFSSPVFSIAFALFEGVLVGGISNALTGFGIAGTNAGVLIGEAVIATLGIFFGMLFVYKMGAVRVTPKFTRIVVGATIAVVILALANFVLSFMGFNVLRDGGPIAILFSLVCIGLGAASFLVDFDAADKMVRAQVPAKMAWGIALGLAVTLVWLYTEILRLLSYFNQR